VVPQQEDRGGAGDLPFIRAFLEREGTGERVDGIPIDPFDREGDLVEQLLHGFLLWDGSLPASRIPLSGIRASA
jgi:hypothetical protein